MGFADLVAVGDVAVRQALGGTVVYTSGVGEVASVAGIFTAPYTRVDVGEQGAGASTVSPTVFLAVADLTSNPETDTAARVTVGGVTYRWDTNDSQPDGMGGVLLLLHKVA